MAKTMGLEKVFWGDYLEDADRILDILKHPETGRNRNRIRQPGNAVYPQYIQDVPPAIRNAILAEAQRHAQAANAGAAAQPVRDAPETLNGPAEVAQPAAGAQAGVPENAQLQYPFAYPYFAQPRQNAEPSRLAEFLQTPDGRATAFGTAAGLAGLILSGPFLGIAAAIGGAYVGVNGSRGIENIANGIKRAIVYTFDTTGRAIDWNVARRARNRAEARAAYDSLPVLPVVSDESDAGVNIEYEADRLAVAGYEPHERTLGAAEVAQPAAEIPVLPISREPESAEPSARVEERPGFFRTLGRYVGRAYSGVKAILGSLRIPERNAGLYDIGADNVQSAVREAVLRGKYQELSKEERYIQAIQKLGKLGKERGAWSYDGISVLPIIPADDERDRMANAGAWHEYLRTSQDVDRERASPEDVAAYLSKTPMTDRELECLFRRWDSMPVVGRKTSTGKYDWKL